MLINNFNYINIPNELWFMIFHQLDSIYELLQIRCVNKHFHNIIKYHFNEEINKIILDKQYQMQQLSIKKNNELMILKHFVLMNQQKLKDLKNIRFIFTMYVMFVIYLTITALCGYFYYIEGGKIKVIIPFIMLLSMIVYFFIAVGLPLINIKRLNKKIIRLQNEVNNLN